MMNSWLGLALAAACVGGGLSPGTWVESLSLRPSAVQAGEVWRLWTGHFVHFSVAHALVNAGVLWLLESALRRTFHPARNAAWLVLAMPLLGLGIMVASPGLTEYRGGSGLAAMFMAWVLVASWSSSPRTVLVLVVLWAVKLSLDTTGVDMPWHTLPDGVALSLPAHVLGILLGIMLAMIASWRDGRRYNPAPP